MYTQFSVLLSTYKEDKPKCLYEALESIFNQSIQPSQVVLVIDGEIIRKSRKVINEFIDKYPEVINVVELPENKGLGNALNEGLKYCNYPLVARMDADDVSKYVRFEKQIEAFNKNPKLSVLGSYVEEFHMIPDDYNSIKKVPLKFEEIKKYALYRNPLNHPTAMFKKEDVLAVGSYKEINLFEDYYLWLRLLKANYQIENIPESLVYFKVGNDLIGRRHGWKYLVKEFNFLLKCRREELISAKSFFIQIFTRLPLRVFPKKILLLVYKFILRH